MFFNIDMPIISQICRDSNIIDLAHIIYLNDRVIDCEIEKVKNEIYVSFKVVDTKSFYTNIIFDNRGNYISSSCTCDYKQIWKGVCRHVSASLFYIYYKKLEFNFQSQNTEQSDKIISKFVSNYLDEVASKTNVFDEKVKLMPKVFQNSTGIYASLQIYKTKKYIIKNISDLLDDIQYKNTVSYGKDLEITHDFNIFDDTSKILVKLLQKYGYNRTYIHDHKYLFLDRIENEFFKIYVNKKIMLTNDNGDNEVFVLNKMPEIYVDFLLKDDELVLKVKNMPMQFFYNSDYAYFIYKDIFMVDMQKVEYVIDLIETIVKSKNNTFVFNNNNMYHFIYFILPKLRESFIINENQLEFVMSNLKYKCSFYLDVASYEIICKTIFFHEDVQYDFIDDAIMKIKNSMLYVLNGFGFFEKEDNIYNLYDEDKIFLFYKYGVDELKKFGEVFISKEFNERAFIPSNFKFSFNLKPKFNLMEISLESEAYTLEELIETLKTYDSSGFYKLKSGKYIELSNDEVIKARNFLMELDIDKNDLINNTLEIQKSKIFKISDFPNLKIEESLKKLLDDIKCLNTIEFQVPESLENVLRNYQKKGYRWLRTLSYYGFGGILSDDMGLGKTLQVITLFLAEKQEGILGQSLVVCPISLIYNWANEIQKFAPSLNTEIIIGAKQNRLALIQDTTADIIITNYESLKRDVDMYKDKKFNYLISDEAQYLKNHKTENAKCIKEIKSNVNFALTGTPIENNLLELWSLFDFVLPGYLNTSKHFTKHFNNPITVDKNVELLNSLKNYIKPFILRRNKKDVLKELPEKIETVFYANMTEEQSKLYNMYLLDAKGELETLKQNNLINKSRIKILALITRLRQICCDPRTFLPEYEGGSGKIDLVISLIKESISSGHRILLFSQFTAILKLIQKELDIDGLPYFYLDGKVSSINRISMVDKFNDGENDIFLISLKAGGSGLNLVGADVVIHFDPWWNYSVMSQATDRAHRIGQEKTVQVLNVVTKNTIEEKIIELQNSKKDLFESVIKDGENFIDKMNKDDLVDLFNISSEV